MNMQNNFTTIEQSDKLIALGLSEGSADMCWTTNGGFSFKFPRCVPYKMFQEKEHHIPCWSAGRLINIFECCTGVKYNHNSDMSLMDDIFSKIQSFINANLFDFSKLEEE